jgi:hypothetical protein
MRQAARSYYPAVLARWTSALGAIVAVCVACGGGDLGGGGFAGAGPAGGNGTVSGSGGSRNANLGTGGGTCVTGTERCDCYANQTCNGGLTCLLSVCVGLGSGGVSSTGGSTSSGAAPSTGGTSSATGGIVGSGGGPVACLGCGANQVCVSGVCTDVPSQCPCPRETYCDPSISRCVVGCVQDTDCAAGRVCNATMRTCFDGCHQDAGCGAGQICDDAALVCRTGCRQKSDCSGGLACIATVCQAGCATTADCTSTGETCVNNSCVCPTGQSVCSGACVATNTAKNCGGCGIACNNTGETCVNNACVCPNGQSACSGACVATNTVNNCGGCGIACKNNETCSNNQCTCPVGTCQPQVVYTNGGTGIDRIWVDGTDLYVAEHTTPITVRRTPVGGGTITLVATLRPASSVDSVAVASGNLIFTDEDNLSGGTTTGVEHLYLVQGAGSTPFEIDAVHYTAVNSSPVGLDATYAYWWTWSTQPAYMTGTLQRITLATRARTTLATASNWPGLGIFVVSAGLYFARQNTDTYELQRAVGTSGVTSLGTPSGVLHALFVDSAGIYLSDEYSGTKRIARLNLDGTTPVTLSSGKSFYLTADATNLYYLDNDASPVPIYRVAKAGGAASSRFYAPSSGAGEIRVAGGYVYFVTGTQVLRLATSYVP